MGHLCSTQTITESFLHGSSHVKSSTVEELRIMTVNLYPLELKLVGEVQRLNCFYMLKGKFIFTLGKVTIESYISYLKSNV